MLKRLVIAILLIGITGSLSAQLYPYKWRVGVSAGYATYYGDVSPFQIDEFGDIGKAFRWFDFNPNYIPQPSLALSLETRLSPTVGIALKGGHYSFAMSDRYVDRSGDLQTESRNFNRALNFKTDLTDVGLSFIFRSDNGKIFNRKALVAPYLGLGAGLLWFDVYADLYDASGQRYDYSSNAVVVDGTYETNLRPLRTEISEGYRTWSIYGELSLGIRFRLAHRWEAFIQSDLKYTATDYLDDVSGRYRTSYLTSEQQYAANPTNLPEDGGMNFRGNPNNANDAYFYHAVGIKFSFAHSKEEFTAPVVYGEGWSDPSAIDRRTEISDKVPVKTAADPAQQPEEDYDEVKINESLREDLKPTMEWLENELAIVQMREREDALARQQDSLQEVRDQLAAQNSALKAQLDTLPKDSAMIKALSDQEMRADSLSAALDSLRSERLVIEEERQSLDSALSAQKEIREAEPQTVETTVVRDTVVQLPKTQAADTVIMKSATAEDRSTDQMIYELMERQAVRDSLIITRLTDLLATSRSDETSTTPEQRSYDTTSETTDTYQSAESGSEVSPGDLESLQMEVQFLREQLDRQSQYTSDGSAVGGVSPNVVVVPSGGGGRDTVYQYDERQATENQQLRAELQQLRGEMEEMRKAMRARDHLIDSYLKETEAEKEQTAEPADTALTDTLVPPPAPIKAEVDSIPADSVDISDDSILTSPNDTTRVTKDTIVADTPEIEKEQPADTPDGTDVQAELTPLDETFEKSVYFALNSVQPSQEEIAKLEQIAKFWGSHPGYRIHLISYADNSGNAAYNRQLCARRNDSVRDVLVEQFSVDPQAIESEVGGPIVREGEIKFNPNDRRVDITIEASK